MTSRLILVRHGETAWSRAGRHTGRTDVPLSAEGRRQAARLADRLRGFELARVLASPLSRAFDTCRIAGLAGRAEVDPDLQEWDYGVHEGRTTDEIRQEIPGWSIWTHPVDGGESVADVGRRADRVIRRAAAADGDVALFAHGHVLRILAARWLGLPARRGGSLALETATISILGHERGRRVIERWNDDGHLSD